LDRVKSGCESQRDDEKHVAGVSRGDGDPWWRDTREGYRLPLRIDGLWKSGKRGVSGTVVVAVSFWLLSRAMVSTADVLIFSWRK
jgi:hypothetical protein